MPTPNFSFWLFLICPELQPHLEHLLCVPYDCYLDPFPAIAPSSHISSLGSWLQSTVASTSLFVSWSTVCLTTPPILQSSHHLLFEHLLFHVVNMTCTYCYNLFKNVTKRSHTTQGGSHRFNGRGERRGRQGGTRLAEEKERRVGGKAYLLKGNTANVHRR